MEESKAMNEVHELTDEIMNEIMNELMNLECCEGIPPFWPFWALKRDITAEEFLSMRGEDIAVVQVAHGGAMGDPRGVYILMQTGDSGGELYYFNHCKSDSMDFDTVCNACVSKGLDARESLGCGNLLWMREEDKTWFTDQMRHICQRNNGPEWSCPNSSCETCSEQYRYWLPIFRNRMMY